MCELCNYFTILYNYKFRQYNNFITYKESKLIEALFFTGAKKITRV
jgi:hypothetical protein